MRTAIEIIDYASSTPVQAELFDEVTEEHFKETQREWRPKVLEIARRLVGKGAPSESIPRHWHWDWPSKEADLRMLAFTFLGVECGGKLQGLMKLKNTGHVARIAEQRAKPLVYVDYVETAPWNIKPLMRELGGSAQFGAVGTRLIEAAVRKSLEEGYKGRLALHSLSGSERFYLDVCGMTAVGRDAAKQNLLWCEFTPEQAQRFLTGSAA